MLSRPGVLPFHDPSRKRRLIKVVTWLLGTRSSRRPPPAGRRHPRLAAGLWDEIKDVPVGYIVAGSSSRRDSRSRRSPTTGSSAPPTRARSQFPPILTAYAVGVAMNDFLPANIGTFVTLLMFVAIIPACTFPGAIAAYLVQKIFFTIAGTFVYLYLFLSVPGSFDENLGNLTPPGARGRDRGRHRLLARPPRPHLLEAGEEALGAGEEGRRHPRRRRSATSPASSCPRSSPGRAS